MNTDKAVALNAWRRVDRRTREAMRRNFLPQLIEGYEVTSKSCTFHHYVNLDF